ncbi:MAG: GDP-mannose 4,6-dehydratase [Chitinispirillaceae bacterium]|nr:GDP-mannose 4,6-dehydratase [Chitinispirillaceae bacterium]
MTSFLPKVFITGIHGFVGAFLAEHLQVNGWSVAGLDRWPSCDFPGIAYYEGDLLDTGALAELLLAVKPAWVVHLAAVSAPGDADISPRHALNVNIMGTAALLDAVRQSCPSSRILIVGSSKQYGAHQWDAPVTESTPCSPADFYGLSKYSAELIGLQFVKQFGMDIRFTRSFNHTGPGQSANFVCSDWAKQAALIEKGYEEPVLRVGDIASSIDFTDVRDVAGAYASILDRGSQGGIYNVCSGSAVALESVCAMLIRKTDKKIKVVRDSAKVSPRSIGAPMIGDHSKLTRKTGWRPEIPLEKTLDDLYRWWLTAV